MIITKLSSWLNIIELLLNPSSGSMFHMFLVSGINGVDKEILNNIFDKLGEIEINSFELEIYYNEEKEAEFIRETVKKWEILKPELKKVIDCLKTNWRKKSDKKNKSYFG